MVLLLLKLVLVLVKCGMCMWLFDLCFYFGFSFLSVVYSLWKFFLCVWVGVGEFMGVVIGVVVLFFSVDVVDVDK